MQRIVGMLLILFALGWLASHVPATPAPDPPRTVSWRRTSDGWQRVDSLYADVPRSQPVFHPVVVGLTLLLFASAALIGLSADAKRTGQEIENGVRGHQDVPVWTSPKHTTHQRGQG